MHLSDGIISTNNKKKLIQIDFNDVIMRNLLVYFISYTAQTMLQKLLNKAIIDL